MATAILRIGRIDPPENWLSFAEKICICPYLSGVHVAAIAAENQHPLPAEDIFP
jgi:hypothetical protein